MCIDKTFGIQHFTLPLIYFLLIVIGNTEEIAAACDIGYRNQIT